MHIYLDLWILLLCLQPDQAVVRWSTVYQRKAVCILRMRFHGVCWCMFVECGCAKVARKWGLKEGNQPIWWVSIFEL